MEQYVSTMGKIAAHNSRDIGVYLKYYFLLSLIIAGVAHLVVISPLGAIDNIFNNFLPLKGLAVGTLRALIYFTAMYVFIIPPFSYLFHRRLKDYKSPTHKMIQKILYTPFCVILLSTMCVFPFIFLLTENSSYGYAGFIYISLTESVLGLSIIGALFSYAATVCFWLLFYAVPRMWITSNNQGD